MQTDRYGYNGTILHVDLDQGSITQEERPESYWRTYGGGGLVATALLLERTKAGIDPLGPENLLVFTSSVVAGHQGPGLARFTVAAKSPMTGGIGETRVEGPWGVALKASGFDTIAVSGRSDSPMVLVIEDGVPRLIPAGRICGMDVGEIVDALKDMLGSDVHVAAIGPAGERMVRYASIVAERGNQASRMGMGAVMGSKNLKAVVLRGGNTPAPHDEKRLNEIRRNFATQINQNDLSKWQHDFPGFSCWIYLHGVDAALCVNNYTKCRIDGMEGFREDAFLRREIADLPCPGCPNNCIKTISPAGYSGDRESCGIHQEITGVLGPNLGITDLDSVLEFNRRCNEYGLDPTSLGFTVSCYMELHERELISSDNTHSPEVHFGDSDGVLRLIDDIARREGIGDALAEGSVRLARTTGQRAIPYAMHVKGLELVPFEPRSQTNLAMGYAVAPIGPRYDICEHDWDFDTEVGWEHTLDLSRTLGIFHRTPMNDESIEKVRMFKALNNLWSAADALDFCIFAIAPTRILSLEHMTAILAAVTGWETSSHEVMRFGERRNHLMRAYNYREGFRPVHDTLPDRFFDEPIAEGPRQGDVLNRDIFNSRLDSYYRMMGWDENGAPLKETLVDALVSPG